MRDGTSKRKTLCECKEVAVFSLIASNHHIRLKHFASRSAIINAFSHCVSSSSRCNNRQIICKKICSRLVKATVVRVSAFLFLDRVSPLSLGGKQPSDEYIGLKIKIVEKRHFVRVQCNRITFAAIKIRRINDRDDTFIIASRATNAQFVTHVNHIC